MAHIPGFHLLLGKALSLHSGKERVPFQDTCSMIKITSTNKERQMQADVFSEAGILWSAICKKRYRLCHRAQSLLWKQKPKSSGAPSSQSQSITSDSICAGKLHFCTLSTTGPCILPWLQSKRSCVVRTTPAKILAEKQ